MKRLSPWQQLRAFRREALRRELEEGRNIFLEALIEEILPTAGSRESAKAMIAQGMYRVTTEFRRQFKCGARIRASDKQCRGQAMANGRCRKHGGLRARTKSYDDQKGRFENGGGTTIKQRGPSSRTSNRTGKDEPFI